MSMETHKYKETILKNNDLFNAKVISFPNEKIVKDFEKLNTSSLNVWKINDKSNGDQLRAVIGICFMFGALIIMGLYSNLV